MVAACKSERNIHFRLTQVLRPQLGPMRANVSHVRFAMVGDVKLQFGEDTW